MVGIWPLKFNEIINELGHGPRLLLDLQELDDRQCAIQHVCDALDFWHVFFRRGRVRDDQLVGKVQQVLHQDLE